MNFRDLTANEVDVRIGQVAKDGSYLTCLLYKDARADMIILDETIGAEIGNENIMSARVIFFARLE